MVAPSAFNGKNGVSWISQKRDAHFHNGEVAVAAQQFKCFLVKDE